jgi:soluble lytic murein transglycosylase
MYRPRFQGPNAAPSHPRCSSRSKVGAAAAINLYGMAWTKQKRRWLVVVILVSILTIIFERCQNYNEHSQDQHIVAAARKYAMDPSLIKAVVWRESRFNPRVRGTVGEIGLMQVGKLAGQEWAIAEKLLYYQHTDLFDPAKNTLAGTWYLRKMLRRYENTDSPAVYALADYNAGRSNVLRWTKGSASTNSAAFLKQMDFPRTREYLRAILKRQPRYQKEFASMAKGV